MSKEFILTIDLEHPDAQKYGSIASILQSAASHFISDIDDWSAAPEDSEGDIRTLHGSPAHWEISGVTKHPRDLLLDEYQEYVNLMVNKGENPITFDRWKTAKGIVDEWTETVYSSREAAAEAAHEAEVERAIEEHEVRVGTYDEATGEVEWH